MTYIPNQCIRCGKQRIVVRTYTEQVGNSLVTYHESACPDSDCQKEVETQLAKEKKKREEAQAARAQNAFYRTRKPATAKATTSPK